MKVTVCFGSVRVIVPCGDGSGPVQDLIGKSITRYKKATGKPSDYWVTIHNLKTCNDGGILDPDDQVIDVADDREQIIAYFEEQNSPPLLHNGGDGASASSVGTSSPDIFQSGETTMIVPIPTDRLDIVVTPNDLSQGSGLHVRRGSEPALNNIVPENDAIKQDASNTGTFPKKAKRWPTVVLSNGSLGQLTSTPRKDLDSSDEEDHRKVHPTRSATAIIPPEKLVLNRFNRDGSRQSLSNNPNMRKWLDAQERHESQFHQTERTDPIGSSMTTSSSSSDTPPFTSPSSPNPKRMVLKTANGPLGIHVVPDIDNNGREMGLLIQGIEPGGLVYDDGRLHARDRIIEINGTCLIDVSFNNAQTIFKEAMKTEEIQLLVLKPDAPPLPKQPPPLLPKPSASVRKDSLKTSPLAKPITSRENIHNVQLSSSSSPSPHRTIINTSSSPVKSVNTTRPGNQILANTTNNIHHKDSDKENIPDLRPTVSSNKSNSRLSVNTSNTDSGIGRHMSDSSTNSEISGSSHSYNPVHKQSPLNKLENLIRGDPYQANGGVNEKRVPPAIPVRSPSTTLSSPVHVAAPSERGFTAPTNTRRIGRKIEIQLTKGSDGLGFSITTRDNPAGGNCPIYIKNIMVRGAAITDGRLKPGDRLLEVNGVKMTGRPQSEAVSILKQTPNGMTVYLVVSRQEVVDDMFAVPRELHDSSSVVVVTPTTSTTTISTASVTSTAIATTTTNSDVGRAGGIAATDTTNHASPAITKYSAKSLSDGHATKLLQPPDRANADNVDGVLETNQEMEIFSFNIPLNDSGSAGLGVSVKGKTTQTAHGLKDTGIFVKAVISGGAAAKHGQLIVNDQLLEVNDITLAGLPNTQAMDSLRRAMQLDGPLPGCINIMIARRKGTPHPFMVPEKHEKDKKFRLQSEGGDSVFEKQTDYDSTNSETSEETLKQDSNPNPEKLNPHKGRYISSAYSKNKSPVKRLKPHISGQSNKPDNNLVTGRNDSYSRAVHESLQLEDSRCTADLNSSSEDSQVLGNRHHLGVPTLASGRVDVIMIEDGDDEEPSQFSRKNRPHSTIGLMRTHSYSSSSHSNDEDEDGSSEAPHPPEWLMQWEKLCSQSSDIDPMSPEADALRSFQREGFGRQSMSEKRKGHMDPRSSEVYQRVKQVQKRDGSKGHLAVTFKLPRVASAESLISHSNTPQLFEESPPRPVGPTLGMKKSSSLESLEMAMQLESAAGPDNNTYWNKNNLGRSRGFNESFRAAVDRSYDTTQMVLEGLMDTVEEEGSENGSAAGYVRSCSTRSSLSSEATEGSLKRQKKDKEKRSLFKGIIGRFGRSKKLGDERDIHDPDYPGPDPLSAGNLGRSASADLEHRRTPQPSYTHYQIAGYSMQNTEPLNRPDSNPQRRLTNLSNISANKHGVVMIQRPTSQPQLSLTNYAIDHLPHHANHNPHHPHHPPLHSRSRSCLPKRNNSFSHSSVPSFNIVDTNSEHNCTCRSNNNNNNNNDHHRNFESNNRYMHPPNHVSCSRPNYVVYPQSHSHFSQSTRTAMTTTETNNSVNTHHAPQSGRSSSSSSRADKIQQLRSDHQRKHQERNGRYPGEEREDGFDRDLKMQEIQRQNQSMGHPASLASTRLHGNSGQDEAYRPESRLGFADNQNYNHGQSTSAGNIRTHSEPSHSHHIVNDRYNDPYSRPQQYGRQLPNYGPHVSKSGSQLPSSSSTYNSGIPHNNVQSHSQTYSQPHLHKVQNNPSSRHHQYHQPQPEHQPQQQRQPQHQPQPLHQQHQQQQKQQENPYSVNNGVRPHSQPYSVLSDSTTRWHRQQQQQQQQQQRHQHPTSSVSSHSSMQSVTSSSSSYRSYTPTPQIFPSNMSMNSNNSNFATQSQYSNHSSAPSSSAAKSRHERSTSYDDYDDPRFAYRDPSYGYAMRRHLNPNPAKV